MKTVIIGTGNVAWHLSLALRGAGHEVLQVVGRSEEKAAEVAGRVGAEALCSYKAVRPDADAYVIAVKDDAVRQVAAALPKELRGVVMHTAGSPTPPSYWTTPWSTSTTSGSPWPWRPCGS